MLTETTAFQIEKVLDETIIEDKPHYLIKWKGYPSTQSTWEPIENLIDTLDIVHGWKMKNSPHSIRKAKLNQVGSIQKTKKIGGKQHQIRDRLLQDKLNSKARINKKRRHLEIDEEDILSIQSSIEQEKESQVDEFSFGQECKPSRKTRSKSTKKPENSNEPKKMTAPTRYFENHDKSDVNGFKIIGKVTKEGVQSVLWCFDWEDKKICEVQLKDGRKVNMRREDVKKICPEKLCEYYQKLEKSKV